MLLSVKIGAPVLSDHTLLKEYWNSTVAIEGGFRLPFCVMCENTEFWILGSYYRFQLKKDARFPIDSFDQHSIIILSGDPVNVYSAFAGVKIGFRHRKKRMIPYLFYGYGYTIMSDLVFDAQPPVFPYFRKKYENSISQFMTFGLDFGISSRFRLLFELSGSGPITGDQEDGYFAYKLGLSLR
jgi:hypothetical protein